MNSITADGLVRCFCNLAHLNACVGADLHVLVAARLQACTARGVEPFTYRAKATAAGIDGNSIFPAAAAAGATFPEAHSAATTDWTEPPDCKEKGHQWPCWCHWPYRRGR